MGAWIYSRDRYIANHSWWKTLAQTFSWFVFSKWITVCGHLHLNEGNYTFSLQTVSKTIKTIKCFWSWDKTNWDYLWNWWNWRMMTKPCSECTHGQIVWGWTWEFRSSWFQTFMGGFQDLQQKRWLDAQVFYVGEQTKGLGECENATGNREPVNFFEIQSRQAS